MTRVVCFDPPKSGSKNVNPSEERLKSVAGRTHQLGSCLDMCGRPLESFGMIPGDGDGYIYIYYISYKFDNGLPNE